MEIAFVLDPSVELRIELESGSEGSLSLNTVLKALGKARIDPATARAIVVGVLLWMGTKTVEYAYNKIVDTIYTSVVEGEPGRNLSQSDIQQIADRVARAMEGKTGEKQAQKLFRELERDKAIRGAGVSADPRQKPLVIVPRAEFSDRGGFVRVDQMVKRRRSHTEVKRVVLISPVLVAGQRRWRFLASDIGEFGAPIKDEIFVDHVLAGDLTSLFRSNTELSVELETIEEFTGEAWKPVERNVLRVVGLPTDFGPSQKLLPFADDQGGPGRTQE